MSYVYLQQVLHHVMAVRKLPVPEIRETITKAENSRATQMSLTKAGFDTVFVFRSFVSRGGGND